MGAGILMVRGLDLFREHFADYTDHYVLIGGSACSLAFDRAGAEFRATKDLDIVLTLEVMNEEFARKVWDFVRAGGYSTYQRSKDKDAFYRFHTPENKAFPHMVELFARNPGMELAPDAHLTPIRWEQIDDVDAKSLSAILMNDAYYGLIHDNKVVVDGLTTVDAPQLIPLKARAWLDMLERRANGGHVDEAEVRKHRNDIVRLSVLLAPDNRIALPEGIQEDVQAVLDMLPTETVDPKSFGIRRPLGEIVAGLRKIYLDE
jgi:hypothetical protein